MKTNYSKEFIMCNKCIDQNFKHETCQTVLSEIFKTFNFNLANIIKKYKKSNFRNDDKLKSLDIIDFISVIWNIHYGTFDIVGYSNKGFLRSLNIKIINSLEESDIKGLKTLLTI